MTVRPSHLFLALPLLFTSPLIAADDQTADFVGRVEPAATVELRSRVDGQVIRVNCRAGEVVKKGAVLFEIDPRPYEIEVRRAEAGIAQAQARLKFYEVERQRVRALVPTGGVNQSEVDRIEAERLNSEATVQSARASLDLAKLNLEYSRVTAPMDGRIGNPLALGNVVRADRYTLGTLVADDPVIVTFAVDERTTLQILKGGGAARAAAAVAFTGEDGFPHKAKIDNVDVTADPKTGTVQWRVLLPNADRQVLPGMFAKVRLTLAQS
jgi:membrane fusion protein, multidrug efflux system